MTDKHEKQEKHEKGLLARTATYTTKKARRTTTRLKQRVGKEDETKDEVFDEFVTNFNKQQAAALRLTTELKNYLRCIAAMQVAASTFGEAVKDVYEDEWSGKECVMQFFKDSDSNWTNLSARLTDEVLEPLMSYQKPFPEVKNKIHKRSRKLVDYDHSRHAVDTLRAKGATKSSDAKKLNLAEEEYQKAKDIFIDLTSELYEELPALYDSRIGFYVSCFQSVFTLEEVFHREAANINHSLNDLLDQLVKDFSAGTYSTRKPFSAGMETTGSGSEKADSDAKHPSGGLAQFYDVAVPAPTTNSSVINNCSCNIGDDSNDDVSLDAVDSSPSDNLKQASDKISEGSRNEIKAPKDTATVQPTRPAPRPPPPPKILGALSSINNASTSPSRPKPPSMKGTPRKQNEPDIDQKPAEADDPVEEKTNRPSPESTVVDESPTRDAILSPCDSNLTNQESSTVLLTQNTEVDLSGSVAGNVVAYKNNLPLDNPNRCNLIVPASIFKVVATHNYSPEDEDELSFEKGEIIHVIPYDDPEEQDDGWLMGVMDSNGLVGVFPENFTKKYL